MKSVPCNFYLQIKVLPYGDYTEPVCFLYHIVVLSTSGDSHRFSLKSPLFFRLDSALGLHSFFTLLYTTWFLIPQDVRHLLIFIFKVLPVVQWTVKI